MRMASKVTDSKVVPTLVLRVELLRSKVVACNVSWIWEQHLSPTSSVGSSSDKRNFP